MPSASPEELAAAISDAIGAGAKVINLSAALVNRSMRGERELQQALDFAAQGVMYGGARPETRARSAAPPLRVIPG